MNAEYEKLVRESDLVERIGDAEYVAAVWTDPVGGDVHAFAEYADDELFVEPGLTGLASALRSRFPDAEGLIVRAPAGVALPAPWRRHLTYVRAHAHIGAGAVPDPAVRPAAPEDRERIVAWLADAMDNARDQQDRHGGREDSLRAAEETFDTEGRRSLVYVHRGEPVGHASYLDDVYDDVTDERFVDLIDIMIDKCDGLDHRTVTAALLGALAARVNRPVIGNVVHPVDPAGAAHAEIVLGRLLGAGWTEDYVYWILA